MRYLKTLAFLACALFGATAFAQSSPQTMSRIRDGALPNNLANVYQFQITFPSTYYGLYTASGTYYYDGDSATFRRWWGKTAGADNITNSTPFPWVGNFNYVFDGTNWDRWRSETISNAMNGGSFPNVNAYNVFWNGVRYQRLEGYTIDDLMPLMPDAPYSIALNAFLNDTSMSHQRWHGENVDDDMTAAPAAPWVAAYNVFYDGTTARRWTGQPIDDTMTLEPVAPSVGAYTIWQDGGNAQRWFGGTGNDGISATQPMPYVHGFSHLYDTTASLWDRVTGVAAGDALSATRQGLDTISLGHFYNGTNFQRWTGTTALPTSVSPMAAPYVGSMSYGYESVGGLFRPLRIDSSGNLYVNQASLLPGEDSVNDWRKTKTQSVATFSPTVTSTATVDATGTIVILASVEVLSYSNFTITVKNTGGVNAIDNVYVEVGPDGTEWSLIATYDTNIAFGASARIVSVSNNSDRYLRVRAAATAAVTTSTNCWITGRVSN